MSRRSMSHDYAPTLQRRAAYSPPFRVSYLIQI
jgi:hypothetical protein